MTRMLRATIAALALAAGLLSAGTAQAGGPLLAWLFPDDGPMPSYSPLRYWAPRLGRAYDHFHGPELSVYPPDRHPEIPPHYVIIPYPHPAADPAETLIPVPSPPAESRFRYFGARD
jgi:hypothetical protein